MLPWWWWWWYQPCPYSWSRGCRLGCQREHTPLWRSSPIPSWCARSYFNVNTCEHERLRDECENVNTIVSSPIYLHDDDDGQIWPLGSKSALTWAQCSRSRSLWSLTVWTWALEPKQKFYNFNFLSPLQSNANFISEFIVIVTGRALSNQTIPFKAQHIFCDNYSITLKVNNSYAVLFVLEHSYLHFWSFILSSSSSSGHINVIICTMLWQATETSFFLKEHVWICSMKIFMMMNNLLEKSIVLPPFSHHSPIVWTLSGPPRK